MRIDYMIRKSTLINQLIDRFKFKSYLEIGTQSNANLKLIKCKYKVGVDPSPKIVPEFPICHKFYPYTSNCFFQTITEKFDIIFIDGLHEADQVYRDIENAFMRITPRGIIVCHDMNPVLEIEQRIPRETKRWNGDCWKAWVRIGSVIINKKMFVVDIDEGCGIICNGKNNSIKLPDKLTYQWLEKNRKEALNLISYKEFQLWLKSIS